MSLSAYLSTKIIDHVLRNTAYTSPTTIYLALFTVLPARDGTGGTEVSGGSYARQTITFAADSDGLTSNTAAAQFTNMPEATIVGAGLYDAVTAGNMLTYGRLATTKVITAGFDLAIQPGDIVEVIR